MLQNITVDRKGMDELLKVIKKLDNLMLDNLILGSIKYTLMTSRVVLYRVEEWRGVQTNKGVSVE